MDIKSRVNQFLVNDEPTRQDLKKLEEFLSDSYNRKMIDTETFYHYTNVIIEKYYREIGKRFCKIPECI